MARQTPHSHSRRRLIVTVCAIGLVLALLAGVGIYGLIMGEPHPDGGRPGDRGTSSTASPSPTEASLAPIPATRDPETFARSVADALFTWDTYSLLSPQDHRDVLLQVADPSGLETPGLVSDLDGYLPDQSTWTQLQEYQTRQWLEIERAYVPDQWADAEAAAGDSLAPGTIAYTIEGIRHREGVWYDKPVTSTHDVAFTIFLTCPPRGDQSCYLLRLSVLDEPLR
ncbi:hypothetical protein [Glutamicibacter sp. BSL13]